MTSTPEAAQTSRDIREAWARSLHDRLRQTTRRALAKQLHHWPSDAEIDARVAEIEGRHAAHMKERQDAHRDEPRQRESRWDQWDHRAGRRPTA